MTGPPTKVEKGDVVGGIKRWWGSVRPDRSTLKDSTIAGLPLAAAAVPDGMASAALVGVSPIHGLYASFIGPIVGGFTASTRLMVIATTSAASLAAFSALARFPMEERVGAMVVLTVLAGLMMVAAGYAGLGRVTAFVSHSVMTGFLTGVGASIALGQVPDLLGADVEGDTSLGKFLDVVTNPGSIDVPSMLIGALALALLVYLPNTPIGQFSSLVVLAVPSAIVAAVAYFQGVDIVSDVGDIVAGLPLPVLPDLGFLTLDLIAGAFAVAAIVLVQGAGVAQSSPNPDGTRSNPNTDFTAQGWANVASGLFEGIPVGGSVGSTAMSTSLGARSRWVAIMSGLWMLAVLVFLSNLAELVAIPTLAAILIVASVGSIRPAEILEVWKAGPQSRIAMVTTFVATLVLPVSAAVGIGVALSLLLNATRQASDIRIVELYEKDGALYEREVPRSLQTDSTVVLQVYGSLFYAGARHLENDLPVVGEATGATVVIRLRGKIGLGATAFSVFSDYAERLKARGGQLVLSGVDPHLVQQFRESGRIGPSEPIVLLQATDMVGESTHAALTGEYMVRLDQSDNDQPELDEPLLRRVGHAVKGMFTSD